MKHVGVLQKNNLDERRKMDAANVIKKLRGNLGMTRREFSDYTGIPVRTLEDWEGQDVHHRNIYQDCFFIR